MDVNSLIELVSNLGVPIALLIYFVWENSKFTKVLADFQLTLEKINTRLEYIEDSIKSK